MGRATTKAKRNQRASGLGRSLMKQGGVGGGRPAGATSKTNAEVERTMQLNQEQLDRQADANQFDSVLERNDLAEFVEMAKLSNKDFTPMQRGPVILSSTTKTALKEPTKRELDSQESPPPPDGDTSAHKNAIVI